MRILAIRGKNLASLAGPFAVDFCKEPLASSGLFAICGPTGSGKSTLLDALCLALYNNTPRLDNADDTKLPDIGEETITSKNPQSLIRRGAIDGYAEVDFIGNDDIAYRARWSVRRAYGKVDGKRQNTEITLQTLIDEQHIGGKDEIEKKIGLSFKQFTRAVLLAQNEFTAFLRSDKKEKADLLEKLSGRDIYKKISIRVFERFKNEAKELDDLNQQFKNQAPLSTEDRTQLEYRLNSTKTSVATLNQHKDQLSRQLQWHEEWEKLKQNEKQALDNVQKAIADQKATMLRQHYFTHVEAVQEARPFLLEIDRIAGEITKSCQALHAAEDQLTEARVNQQQADTGLKNAAQAVAAAQHNQVMAKADLEHAKILDTEINTLIPVYQEAKKTLNDAHKTEAQEKNNLADKQLERNQIAQNLQTAQDWLATHESLRILAEDWSRWDTLFKAADGMQRDFRQAETIVNDKQQDEKQQRQTLNKVTQNFTEAEAIFQIAENQLQIATHSLARFSIETLAANRRAAETRRDQLADAAQIWKALTESTAYQSRLDSESSTVQQRIAQAKIALSQIHSDKPIIITRLEQAQKSLKIVEAACAETVEALRETLEADLPCPVCGSTAHPYITNNVPSHSILASLKEEVSRIQKELYDLGGQEATYEAHLASDHQRLGTITKEQEPLITAIQQSNAAWKTHPLAMELHTVAFADGSAWLTAQNQIVRKKLDEIAEEEKNQRHASEARDKAQTVKDQAQQRYLAAQNAVTTAQTALNQAIAAAQTANTRQSEIAQQLNEWLIQLDAVFLDPYWRLHWQADPGAFYQTQCKHAEQWNEQHHDIKQWQILLGTLDIECKALTNAVAEKAAHLQRATEEFEKTNHYLQDKRQQRQILFGGCPVSVTEATLAQAIEEAEANRLRQNYVMQKTATAQASAETLRKQAQQTLDDNQRAAEQAAAALNSWIAEFSVKHSSVALDTVQLRNLLTYDNRWLTQERAALQALADAIQTTEAVFRERQLQRELHEQQRTTLDTIDMIQIAQKQIGTDLDAANSDYKEAEIALRQDNDRRAKVESLRADIARQEAKTEIWQKLNALIGSADGQKFRNYAQQLTLGVLLRYANYHLADLSRRYRLKQVENTLALMVIDQDMGDEPRSVHSLSGGESFLVSLALALGLASLSSNRVRVESLFIDEGFGSLDADTLRIAMDALDRLQAQGRKVGVISHVHEMSERIGVQIQVQRQSSGQSRVEIFPPA